MPVKNNNRKKKGKAKGKDPLNAIKSREEFESRIMEYASRGHSVIIALKPSLVAMKIASEAGKRNARNSDNVATTSVPAQ
jgi:hypothetical protein